MQKFKMKEADFLKPSNRILSFLLSVIMVITFALPTFAQDIEPVQDVIDLTGGYTYAESGLDAITPGSDSSEGSPGNLDSSAPSAFLPEGVTGDPNEDAAGDNAGASEEDESSGGESDDLDELGGDEEEEPAASAPGLPAESPQRNAATLTDVLTPALGYSTPGIIEDSIFHLDCTPEQAAEIIAFYEYVKGRIARKSNPRLRAAPGDNGIIDWTWGEAVGMTFPSGDPSNPYYVDYIPRLTLTTADPPLGRPFCVEFGTDPSGNYTAEEGSDDQILSLLVAFKEGAASAVGTQLALWHVVEDLPFDSHSQAAAALSAASSVDTDGYTYLYWDSGSGQPFVTLEKADGDPDPDPDPDPDDGEEGIPPTRTEVNTETSTRTEIRSSTTFEYSDAIGQVLIAKRDNEGRSLDGAIFNVQVRFSNGQTAGDSAFEVYNGSRLFTYTHPANNHQPAVVTVTEIRSPDGYTGTTQPQTATIHPTYTRITKVMTHTITITTTTTTTTVINIDTDEIVSESSASADAETELNPPTVQEYTDFIEGDREVSLTFVNTPKPCSLTIYKYEKGSYSTALAGARFRIRYADTRVSGQVWELTTGSDGKIVIDPLPAAGTLVCEELQAPGGYEIGEQSTFTITVARGENKRLDVSNDKRAQLIVYKRDAVSGQLLQGAVFRATLIAQGIIKTATSGPDGKAVFSDLTPGQWRVEEQTPPPYFLPTTKVETVTIPDGSYRTLELTFENEPYSGLTIRKVSYQDGRGLSGAVFGLYRGTEAHPLDFFGEFTTDTNGRIIITNLESDQYYTIKELQPPINHLLDEEDVRTILVKPDALNQNITLVFRNKEKPKIEISKVDDKGNPIANCTFRISRRDSAEYTTATTDINGKALVEGLYEDWYQVEETRSADGFILDWDAQNVELEAGKTTKLQFVNYTKPGLTIRKVDAATGQGLDGAVIRVWRDYDYDSSEGPSPTVAESFALPLTRNYIGASYQDYTTTGGGYVRLEGLDAGVVLVQEQSAPQGFYRDDSVHRVELIPGESHEIVIRNYRLAKLNIRKIDATTGQGLDGAVIRVWREGVDEYQDYISSGGGYIRLIDQPAGFVLMQEQKVPSGYQIDDTIHRVELKLGQTHDVVIQNTRLATLTVRKIDSATGRGLDGAVFRVWREGVDEHQDYTTAGGGYIRLTDQAAGFVLLQELRAPDSYQLDEQIHRIELTLAQNHDLIIENHRLPKLTIKKIDEQTLNGIEGVTFRLTKDGEFRDVTTGKDGLISVQLSPGWWTYEETSVPNGWILDPTPGHVELVTGQDKEIVVKNRHKPSLKIVKLDAVTRQPMADVGFEISVKNGAPVGTYRTDNNGEIMLVDINPNTYVIKELPFPGYIALETQKEVFVDWGKVMTVEFRNQPKSPIFIKKINSVTGEPLEGALFSVSKVDGTFIGEYRTGRNGYATVAGVQPGFYLIAEKQPAPGFILDEAAKIVELKLDSVVEVEFLNRPLNGIEIYKIDSKTREPLEGAEFTVKTKAGELIGVYKTSVSGRIEIPELQPGWYSVYESATSSPEYLLDGTVRDVELKFNDHVLLEFSNTKYSGVQVQKVDSVTKAPIQGAKFRVTKLSGDIIGEYVTGPSGFFVVEGLEPGTYYTCFETATVPGYIHDPTPQTFKVSKGESALIQFENAPLSGLQIRKTDSVTGLPLAGVEFKLTELNGRLIGNYTTPDSGIIFVEDLKPGYYVVQEVKSLPTHKPDTAPRNVEIKTGELNVVEYRNRPYPVLELQKVDADTLQPLSGVRFKLLDRYQREIGIYTTSELGKITLSGMDEGKFFLQEVEAKAGYQLDSTVREVSLQWGKTTTVEVKNTPLATLRIKKIDAISKKPLPGVVFLLRDMKNNIIGEYTTNSSGLIELPKTIASGKYKLQEIKTDDQHVLDEQIREIELKAGETTELVIENAPKRGRFQIVKKAADANPVTGAKAGALLKGAEFEILNEKLEVVDTIETDKNGVATSIDLPLGKYAIRETESAEYYLLDDSVFYGELKLHGDLVRFEVLNKSAILDVTIEKRGNVEVIPGDLLRYDFMNITNASNVELHDFYWRDVLPTDAVRLETLHTGTWSQRVRFDVEYRTNQRKNWRTWESGLNSNTANELNVKDLKLAANEYVTEFQLVFDTVAPEFHCTEDPYIITKTLEDLEGGYVFTNRTDVGGTVDGEEWIYAKDQWRTSVFALPKEPLPRTGY